jgi:hypothetical protein
MLMAIGIVMAACLSLRAQIADLRLARPDHHVCDFARVVDAETQARIENVLALLQARTGINFVVVTISTIGNQDLYDYSLAVAKEWEIGSETSQQKSVLLLIAADSGRFFSLSSRGAQAQVPEGLVGFMGRRMRPMFQTHNYNLGLETGIKSFIDILGQRWNFTYAALDQQRIAKPGASPANSRADANPALQPIDYKRVPVSGPTVTAIQPDAKTRAGADMSDAGGAPGGATSTTAAPLRTSASKSSAGRAALALPAEKALPVRIPRFKTAPVIDGRLDDDIWQHAIVLRNFYQVQPGDNISASHPTEVLLGYDDKCLYIAFRAHDDSGKVRATLAARDQISDDDTVGIFLDTFNDQRKAYQLFFNPLGVQADAIFTEGQGSDSTVDIVMQSKGAITADGYVVEVAVPFKSLRYEAGDGKLWGVQLQRRIKHLNDELDSWMPISRDILGYLNQEGHLAGLERISRERTLDIIPTLTVSENGQRTVSTTAPDGTRFVNNAAKVKPGLTMKYGIRPNVTASLTLNPDFADVEADKPVITANQRFPIFFEEKRPFFLEGIDVFTTPLQAVHTRAIVTPDVAAKLTGKIGRDTFGFLFASDTAPGNFSTDERNDPKNSSKIAKFLDKNATIAVLRLKHDLGRQSNVGLIATSYDFVEKHNQLAGIDGRFRLNPQTSISFQVLGTTSRQFFYDPNLNDNVYRTGNGLGYSWSFENSKRHLYVGLSGEGRTRDYIADVGFTKRTDTNAESFYLSYSSEPQPKARLISWRASNSLSTNFNWQGRSQNWDNYSDLQFNFRHQTYFDVAYDEGYERLFENEFGASRTASHAGAFSGVDPERSTRKRSLFFSGGATPGKKYSAYAFFGRTWGAFDYDFGAKPRFARVSPAALLDPNAPLDPGAGNSSDVNLSFTYQPTQSLRTSFSYNRSKLDRLDTKRVAFSDQIYSLHADYRFTRFLFMRGRLDYDWLSANVLGQLLMGWTPNPDTAVYLGYDDYLNYNGFNPITGRFEPGLHRNERVLFLKMSYLFRHSFQ